MEARFPLEELNYGVAPQVLTFFCIACLGSYRKTGSPYYTIFNLFIHNLPTIKASLSKVSSLTIKATTTIGFVSGKDILGIGAKRNCESGVF
ncbi:hypothetical protein LYNGBM3L_37300 [Moorena producens 3L]|uniref:Uncharacterized protein n=1 Tax=Moorena producens 3L TaxID=489825 RepID=F4XPY4_9CYAN|nr:hypothetical protein LYNGBM3L_37300 [Moorena producens 3L]OLT68795.1 hypothetical protein BI334_30685 [Moorena producens 3L]